jgi:hypothetical protein
MAKVSLGRFEEILEKEGVYTQGDTTARLSLSGYFVVIKDGQRRLYESVRDCWMAV